MPIRSLVTCLLLLITQWSTHAESIVLRDSIGPDSTFTDGMPGGSTLHLATTWSTSAFALDIPETAVGVLSKAQIVIFARDLDFNPENDLDDIYLFSMHFHVWSDGIDGGPDSFDANPRGFHVPGHANVEVNCIPSFFGCVTGTGTTGVIDVQEFGTTGPPVDPTAFTTFEVTIDLSSFGIELQGGEQHVAAVIDPNRGPIGRGAGFRLSGSRATGSEDLFRQFDTDPSDFPGFVSSDHNFGHEQYAARVTLGNGDFDDDRDADGLDFLEWQRNFGSSVADQKDANGDGIVDGKDLNVWQATFGKSWPEAISGSSAVPEPTTAVLALSALAISANRRHR